MEVEQIDLCRLKPNPENPRKNDPAVDAVARSIQAYGFNNPIITDADLNIAAGHTRLKAAIQMGLSTVPVIRVLGLVGSKFMGYAIADNQTATIATWDDEKLHTLVAQLNLEDDFDIASLGFSDNDLADILRDDEADAGIDDVPEPPAVPVTQPGDLWLLGDHRLLCGDITRSGDITRVMNGEKADFIFTDPPYGHNNNDGDLIHNWEKALGKPRTTGSVARPIANDGAEDAARVYSALLATANDLLHPGGCCCCCCGGGGPDPQFARWAIEMDRVIGFKHAVVWDKGGLGMGWHYRRNYEMILIAQKRGGPCRWFGGTDVSNVIRDIGKIIPSAEQHPTEKPVALVEHFMRLHSLRSETVFDPFVGSGTTIIAAEKLGRRCLAIDIEPKWCDVAVERYEKLTGGKAQREQACG